MGSGEGGCPPWRWARTDLNRRPTGYEPVALNRTKLRAHQRREPEAPPSGVSGRVCDLRPRTFEPLTFRLTADRSAAELRRHRGCRAVAPLIAFRTGGWALVCAARSFRCWIAAAIWSSDRSSGRPELARLVGHDGPIGRGWYHPLPLQQVQRIAHLVNREVQRFARPE